MSILSRLADHEGQTGPKYDKGGCSLRFTCPSSVQVVMSAYAGFGGDGVRKRGFYLLK